MSSSMKGESSTTRSNNVMDTFKGICIVLLLIVAAGAGGYFYGTHQQFAPVETGTSASSTSTSISPTTTTETSSNLKKKYWLATTGDDHVGYAVSVYVNGQLADKFFSPHKKTEITKLVKPGENQITFESKLLPQGMREHIGQSNYYLIVSVNSGAALNASNNIDNLLNYKRNASEDKNFNDSMSFVAME